MKIEIKEPVNLSNSWQQLDLNYPRPQLRRERWLPADSGWTLNSSPIRVPYPPESRAADFHGNIRNGEGKLIYKTGFAIPEDWHGDRIILHFGAVDQTSEIYINDKLCARHKGGYLPFAVDITEYITDGKQDLRVEAEDNLLSVYPYGKQSKKPGGMWYTQVSGIWKQVWIEPVPRNYISAVKIQTSLTGFRMKIMTDGDMGKAAETYEVNPAGDVKAWTPETPYLYPIRIEYGEDSVLSYAGLRTIETWTAASGPKPFGTAKSSPGSEEKTSGSSAAPGVFLNGERIFLNGVLDQGYFPEGIYVPESMEEYARDILRMKELGFNMLRKHCKVEPEQYYYLCDVLGMLVMQDMVNSGKYRYIRDTVLPTVGFHLCPQLGVSPRVRAVKAAVMKIWFWRKPGRRERNYQKRPAHSDSSRSCSRNMSSVTRHFFVRHMKETLRLLHNHPSVIAYTIFNEGWGQFDSDRLYHLAKKLDPGRIYDSASGWFAGTESDFDSVHIYFRNVRMRPGTRPLLISEVGGYTYIPEESRSGRHDGKESYGYGSCSSSEELTDRIAEMYEQIIFPAIPEGLSGLIYTQLSDIEEELNGFYTYDRKICKVDKERMAELAERCLHDVRTGNLK